MDVDGDVDGKLLQQFSSLGTTDKEVLISEFQKLLGDQLNPAGCAFFLDMNNWNLQAAICAYYDFEQPAVRLPSMSVIRDVTVGEGESVPPDTKFIKTWRMQNTGTEQWPPSCFLKFYQGEQLSSRDWVTVEALDAGQMTDVSVEMHSPTKPGIYQGQWRMCTATGIQFGEMIWAIICVAEGGVLGVTQQLVSLGRDFTPPSAGSMQTVIHSNPFGPLPQPTTALVSMTTESSMDDSEDSPTAVNPALRLSETQPHIHNTACNGLPAHHTPRLVTASGYYHPSIPVISVQDTSNNTAIILDSGQLNGVSSLAWQAGLAHSSSLKTETSDDQDMS